MEPPSFLEEFLNTHPIFPQFFFIPPKEDLWIGCGIAQFQSEEPQIKSPIERWFFAQDFPIERKSTLWDGFPEKIWILPSVEFRNGKNYLRPSISSPFYSTEYQNTKNDSRKEYFHKIQEVIKELLPQEKVVIAHKNRVQLTQQIPFSSLSGSLLRTYQNAICFGFALSPFHYFCGATPETLFRLTNRELCIDALAGSIPKKGVTSPLSASAQMKDSEKLMAEFKLVTKGISDALQTLHRPVTTTEITCKETYHLYHLYQQLRSTWDDDQLSPLLRALHPTPAVAGYPKNKALETISRIESFDRGWYSAPLGYKDSTGSHMCVALRSMLIHGTNASLFAGGGIVQQSNIETEWEELQTKLGVMNALINT